MDGGAARIQEEHCLNLKFKLFGFMSILETLWWTFIRFMFRFEFVVPFQFIIRAFMILT